MGDQAKGLINKYDEDQSGMMEFDEFKKLAMALRAVNLNLDDAKTADAANEKARALRKEKATKPPASSSSSTPMLAAKLSEEEVGAKPASAPPKKPTDDDEYEYYDGDGEEDAPKK